MISQMINPITRVVQLRNRPVCRSYSDFRVRCASTHDPHGQVDHSGRFGRERLPENHLASGISPLIEERQTRVNGLLANYLTLPQDASLLQKAMHYAVFGGGKRLRPLLVYAGGETLGAPLENLDHLACAVELIHTYSLVHDDLPALDNDDFRRGNPACHRTFNEAIALLAGDALQSLAFNLLSQSPLPPLEVLTMVQVFSHLIGHQGMIGGEAMEFSKLTPLTVSELEQLYALKTSRLLETCVHLSAIVAHSSLDDLKVLKQFSTEIGIAFQIQDDCQDQKVSIFNYLSLTDQSTALKRISDLYQGAKTLLHDHFGARAGPLYHWLSLLFPNLA